MFYHGLYKGFSVIELECRPLIRDEADRTREGVCKCVGTHALECVECSFGSTAASASLSPKLTHHTHTVLTICSLLMKSYLWSPFLATSTCCMLFFIEKEPGHGFHHCLCDWSLCQAFYCQFQCEKYSVLLEGKPSKDDIYIYITNNEDCVPSQKKYQRCLAINLANTDLIFFTSALQWLIESLFRLITSWMMHELWY